jgi:long-chain fatty acid transport protein
MTRFAIKSLVSAVALGAMASTALAGGYSRGSANVDPLFDEGTSITTSLGITSPSRGMAQVDGVATNATTGADFASTYATFGATVATDLFGGARCAGSLAQPFGANADYGLARIAADVNGAANTGPNTTSTTFESMEFGATCSYGMEAGPGKAFVFGGLFYQTLDYLETRGFGLGALSDSARIEMSDGAAGYRLGVAYTIPEVALKAVLSYRSSVDHRMEGEQVFKAPMPVAATFDIYAEATTPQSVKLALQSGIAEGWLAFASVEWTDWSVIQRVPVLCDGTQAPFCVDGGASPGQPGIDGYFGDGWTVNAGIGHKFNDLFSGSFSVTWDKGVSEAFMGANRSTFTDTWTFALGGAFTPNANSSFRAGAAYSILAGGSETGLGGGKTLTYDTDYALSLGLQGNVKF